MDGAVIGEESMVAALAFVKAGFEVPPRTLVGGIPARIIRTLSDDEIAWKSRGTTEYQELARRCLASLEPVEPLAAPEPDRARLDVSRYKPLYETRGQ
jgi:phenylacetic acid degradation protein